MARWQTEQVEKKGCERGCDTGGREKGSAGEEEGVDGHYLSVWAVDLMQSEWKQPED